MELYIATAIVFLIFTLTLSVGIIIKGRAPSTCATARKAGDHGEIGCGSCAVIDKEDCNKNPQYRAYLKNQREEKKETKK